MKILVLSLLRIGDIVLSAPVLRAIRERNPDAELHVLINSQFRQIAPLIPYVDRFIYFDRNRLQNGLGDIRVPIFESYERLNEKIDDLNSQEYDWTINLTQNRLSGWLMSLINSKERTGLCLDSHGRASFNSNWFKYLNQQVDSEGAEVFHYADVFRNGLNLSSEGVTRSALVETVDGRNEANSFISSFGSQEIISVQLLTSDTKKDWSFAQYSETLLQIHRVYPRAVFAILGASFEKERLAPFMKMMCELNLPAQLAILSFEGAFSLLRASKMLISGDTSVKHLACAAKIPVVEISLGSSDVYRTGSYHHGSVIIQSLESCAPCPHSNPCHRTTHACASGISSDLVAMVSCEVYVGRKFQLKAIADEYAREADVLRVDTETFGSWVAYSVNEPFSESSIARWIDLTCRRIWLDHPSSNPSNGALPHFGTEILRLTRMLRIIHPEVSDFEWRHLFGAFERQAQAVVGRVHSFKVGLQYLRGHYEDPKKLAEFVRGLISFREKIRCSPLLSSFKNSLDQVIEDNLSPAFTRYRRMNDLVEEIDRRTEIFLKLIRGLEQTGDEFKEFEKS